MFIAMLPTDHTTGPSMDVKCSLQPLHFPRDAIPVPQADQQCAATRADGSSQAFSEFWHQIPNSPAHQCCPAPAGMPSTGWAHWPQREWFMRHQLNVNSMVRGSLPSPTSVCITTACGSTGLGPAGSLGEQGSTGIVWNPGSCSASHWSLPSGTCCQELEVMRGTSKENAV